jgi:hypothetical protein
LSDHTHAEHRPFVGQDPAHEHDAPTSMGQLYPQGDIMAVIDDRAEAERAVLSLKEAGVPEGDIDLVDGPRFLQSIQEIKDHRNPLESVLAMLAAEEGEVTKQLAEQAAQGHTIVVVHAQQTHVSDDVVQMLTRHGAHTMHHYGQLVMTDL